MGQYFRIASLVLLPTPFAGYAQSSGLGLEVPAPAMPNKGRFLAGAYGYGVQPYLRY